MKKLFFFIAPMLFAICARANDGGFYVNGNQLVPMQETNISVKKEILTINRSVKNPQQVEVAVYYEFYNPGAEKSITVGFEADSPSGDANIEPVNGQQHYIHHFTVEMNGKTLPYQVAIVGTKNKAYYQNGEFRTLTQKQIQKKLDEYDGEYAELMYVYHFSANFRKGLNIIKHTYTCDFSTFVMSNYEFEYILSAAMRWGNRQIDDFTLDINMGNEQQFDINKTFFRNADEWKIVGIGKKANTKSLSSYAEEKAYPSASFYIKKGYVIFQKKNFKPKGELQISSPVYIPPDMDTFNYRKQMSIYPDMINSVENSSIAYRNTTDKISRKILRNIPFAKHGYIFSDADLKKYFDSQIWYFPDPAYKPDATKMSHNEQKWIQYLSHPRRLHRFQAQSPVHGASGHAPVMG